MNNIINIFKIALVNLRRNKGRTILSVTGITIGIATVLVIFSTGEAIEKFIIDQVNSFGTDYIQVEVKVPSTSQASAENVGGIGQGVAITTLTLDDAEAASELDNISRYYAGILDQKVISYRDFNDNVFIFGVNASFIDIDPANVARGRFFSQEEGQALANVAVLGSQTAENIFNGENPIGKNIRVHRQNYEVVGVMESKGATVGFDFDEMIYIPIQTVQKKLLGVDYVTFIFFQVFDTTRSEFTALQVEDIIRERHNISDPSKDDFAVTTSEEALEILGTITDAVSLLLLLIASISLLVGSVGIMNIMFVSVTERIREIGLRKAVGASPKTIRNQFLAESVVVTGIGGIFGVILGVILTYLVSFIAGQLGFEWPAIFRVHFFVISIGVSFAVGLLAGILPAQKASKLDPIEALRK